MNFSKEANQTAQEMMEWVARTLIDLRQYRELVLVMQGRRSVEFSHSGAFVTFYPQQELRKMKKDKEEAKPYIRYLDSVNENMLFWPRALPLYS